MPIDALVSPFPNELTTPPVTKMCLAMIFHPPGKRNSIEQVVSQFGAAGAELGGTDFSPCVNTD
jgi:hypothetical protein